jgi:hypothetical protein
LVTPLGKGINFLRHLGFSSSSFGLINLKVPKLTQYNLQNIQFKAELREFHSEFSSWTCDRCARVYWPIVTHRAHVCQSYCVVLCTCTQKSISVCAQTLNVPLSTLRPVHLCRKIHIVSLFVIWGRPLVFLEVISCIL